MNNITLLETTFSETPRVDREAGVIHGVKVLGRFSRYTNGTVRREYSDAALSKAARLYEGIIVNLDHPDEREAAKTRRFADGVGQLRGVTLKEDGVYGDLHLIKSHPSTPIVLEAAEMMPERFGLSQNAAGSTVHRDGRLLVEDVELVRSVDIVRNPATNRGLFESQEEPEMKTRKLREIVESAPEKTKRRSLLKALLEMDMGGDPLAEMPVEVVDESTPEDQIRAGLMAAVNKALEGATEDQLKKVLEALGLSDSVTANVAGTTTTDTAAESDAGTETTESAKEKDMKLQQLTESVEELKRERDDLRLTNSCRTLLESSGREITDSRLTILKRLANDDERKAAIAEWPSKDAARPGKPAFSAPLLESATSYKPASDAKTFAERIRA